MARERAVKELGVSGTEVARRLDVTQPAVSLALPVTTLLCIGVIVALYVIAAEITKRSFYKRVNF